MTAQTRQGFPWGIVLIVGGLAWFLLNLSTLITYPAPYDDDAFFASIAATFIRTGQFGFPLYADFYGSATTMVHVGRAFILTFVALFSILGVGLFQARLIGLLGGVTASLCVFILGRQLWGKKEGLLAALLTLLSWQMFWASHTTRPDNWINTAGLLGLLFLRKIQQEPSLGRGFLLGLLTGLMLEIHLKSVLYMITIGLYAVFVFGRTRTQWPILGAFVGGGGLAGILWVGIHFLPDPALMLLQWRSGLYAELLQPGVDIIAFIDNLLVNGILQATRFGWLEFACFVIGLVLLVIRRSANDKFILAVLAIFTGSYIALMPYKAATHLMLFKPLLGLTTGAGLWALASIVQARVRIWAAASPGLGWFLAAPLLFAYLSGNIYLAWANRQIEYTAYSHQISQSIPASASVLGESIWWYQFQTGTYTSDLALAKAYARVANFSEPALFIEGTFRERQIEYVLLDERVSSSYLAPQTKADTFYEALTHYTHDQCVSIETISGQFYGIDASGPALKITTVYQCR